MRTEQRPDEELQVQLQGRAQGQESAAEHRAAGPGTRSSSRDATCRLALTESDACHEQNDVRAALLGVLTLAALLAPGGHAQRRAARRPADRPQGETHAAVPRAVSARGRQRRRAIAR